MSQPRHDLIAQLPTLIAATVTGILPGLAQCEGITGRFDVDRLGRTGVNAPAVLISLIGLRQGKAYAGDGGGIQTYQADFAAFVIARDTLGLSRDESAGAMVQAMLRLIPENRWGQIGVGPATDVQASSLNNEAIFKKGIALWGISWVQQLGLQDFEIPLPVPIDLYLGQAPEIGPGNEDDYTLITTGAP